MREMYPRKLRSYKPGWGAPGTQGGARRTRLPWAFMRRAFGPLVPKVFFVVRDFVEFEERAEFFLEGLFSVVVLLAGDIFRDDWNVGSAD